MSRGSDFGVASCSGNGQRIPNCRLRFHSDISLIPSSPASSVLGDVSDWRFHELRAPSVTEGHERSGQQLSDTAAGPVRSLLTSPRSWRAHPSPLRQAPQINVGSAASSGVSVFVVPMMRLAAAWSPARLTDRPPPACRRGNRRSRTRASPDRRAPPAGRRHARGRDHQLEVALIAPERGKFHCRVRLPHETRGDRATLIDGVCTGRRKTRR